VLKCPPRRHRARSSLGFDSIADTFSPAAAPVFVHRGIDLFIRRLGPVLEKQSGTAAIFAGWHIRTAERRVCYQATCHGDRVHQRKALRMAHDGPDSAVLRRPREAGRARFPIFQVPVAGAAPVRLPTSVLVPLASGGRGRPTEEAIRPGHRPWRFGRHRQFGSHKVSSVNKDVNRRFREWFNPLRLPQGNANKRRHILRRTCTKYPDAGLLRSSSSL